MKSLYSKTDFARILDLEEEPYRGAFRRDNGRLIHSAVFRRLQGKTQLFPNYESDFFRNRLTHSIEVAQIAKGIAERINDSDEYFKLNPISVDLVETSALAHDLGHPPFGHNGEKALDEVMKEYGGFEGNAQTLRILARLEKKSTVDDDYVPIDSDGNDRRYGLNLSYRTLAAILKYDSQIPIKRNQGDALQKGYYYTEKDIVEKIKLNVLGYASGKPLKTIECQIMDIADDIAYSTYDLEDAFKAGFLSPLAILSSDSRFIEKIAEEVQERSPEITIDENDVSKILVETYHEIFDDDLLMEYILSAKQDGVVDEFDLIKLAARYGATYAFVSSNRICSNGYYRTKHTSSLVNKFMSGIEVGNIDNEAPALTKIGLKSEIRKQVEVLKRYTYCAIIESPRLKIAEFRGYDIIREIFATLVKDERKGYNLLPQDYRGLYNDFKDEALKKRVVCDFIAGMTDQYAVEFYSRLRSENPQTIFKPF